MYTDILDATILSEDCCEDLTTTYHSLMSYTEPYNCFISPTLRLDVGIFNQVVILL